MIVLVGASASGKTEIAHILTSKYGYKKCVTTTTREKRVNEQDGIDYHFITKEHFLELKEENRFAESAVYQDNYYGLQVKDIIENGIAILEPKGVNELIRQKRNIYVIYIQTSENLRKERMEKRLDKKESISNRILNDRTIFEVKHITHIDLLIENEKHDLNEVAKTIHEVYQESLKLKTINKNV
ncbi:similar to guanylate kinase [Alteracholeplasma palmae J233]|uniref:Similar to guanylate kinase n=1 Tax=Alteracholeplasma palmae (strain ATCC 49389 / J233) TaxID=1318466 RepID=U4KK87_ALTPJ|nr:AAA family ATPase [Alteracholeplasma palmae]CCV63923.1 similar to guanylate kinase [Alteracholeplasma palmae J233]